MTQARATKRRTTLEKNQDEVVALLLTGWTQEQVATKYAVNPSSVHRFIKRHEDRLEALHEEVARRVEDYAIADVVNRVAAQDDRWRRGQQVIAERAADPAHSDVPGWKTGLLVHTYKAVGSGRDTQIVDEYQVDTALMAEIRATEKAAQDSLGQTPRPNVNIDARTQVLFIERDYGDIDTSRV